MENRFWIDKYGERFFAVYDGNDLLAVTVYKRGAREIVERLNDLETRIEKLRSELRIGKYSGENK